MFPPGVETRPIVWNLPTALTGGLVDTIDVEVTPILGAADALVWTATGEQLTSLSDTFTGTEGVAFDIPVVDQDGWRDPAGNNFTNWAYKAVATITKGRQAITYEKNFQIKLADLDLDLALVPDGPAGDPTFTPVPPGKSAYEIAVDHGYVGTETEWLDSLHSTIPGPPSTIPGPPNTLAIGTVGSGASPAASITGTSPNQTLNLTLVPGIGVPTTGNNPGDLLRWNGTVWIQTATKFHEGTGNPNGAVTAPVGSTFVNTESGGYNGARRWTKATGTGNTGWVVVDGDTGLMTLKNNLVNGWTHSLTQPTGMTLQRVNNTVTLTVNSSLVGGSATSTIFLDPVPVGFRIHRTSEAQNIYLPLIRSGTTTPSAAAYSYGGSRAYLVATMAQNHHGIATWNTQEAWPAANPYPSI